MVTEELLRYVEHQANRGVDKNSIRITLLQAGWTSDDIKEAFTVVETVTPANSTQNQAQDSAQDQEQDSAQDSAQDQELAHAKDYSASDEIDDISDDAEFSRDHASADKSNQVEINNLNDSSQSTNNLKYRQAKDWQQPQNGIRKIDNVSLAKNNPDSQNSNQPQSQTGNTIANEPIKTEGKVKPEVSVSSGFGVYRPKVGDNTSLQSADMRQPRQNQNISYDTDKVIKSSPATDLSNQKKSQAKKSSSMKAVLISLLLLVICAAAGYYFFYMDKEVSYDISDVIESFLLQDSVVYSMDGVLPLSASDSSKDRELFGKFSESGLIPLNIKGLVEPKTGKNGYGLTVDDVILDYVYDGNNSYIKVRRLPAELTESNQALIGQWYELVDEAQTRDLLQLVSDTPTNSLTRLGDSLKDALVASYQEDLIDISFAGSNGRYHQFNLSFDPAVITARLSQDGFMVADLVDLSGLNQVSGVVLIDPDTLLPTQLNLTLNSVDDKETKLTTNFTYRYDGASVGAPPESKPVAEVVETFKKLISIDPLADFKSQLQLVASGASTFFSDNQTYVGICEADSIVAVTTYLKDTYNYQVQCKGGVGVYAYQSPLPEAGYSLCVDRNYVPVVVNQPYGAQTLMCAAAIDYPAPRANEAGQTQGEVSASSEISDEEFFE